MGGGGGGSSGAPEAGADSWTGVSGLLSIADKGLGGAMVPNKMEANCLADPPLG